MKNFDMVVLGSGPSGRRAAIQAAKLGHSVLIVDNRERVGGVSVHTGTIPSKTLRETVLNLTGWRERGFYGRSYRVKKDICGGDLAERLGMTLNHEVDVLDHQFARNGVNVQHGAARFLDAHRIAIQVEAQEGCHDVIVHAEKVVIAVGSKPYRPKDVPFDGYSVLDSDEFIAAPRVPRSLTVIGAGVIGMEYATIFSALDVPVSIIEPRETILDFIDHEVVANLVYQLRDRGVAIHLGAHAATIQSTNSQGVLCKLKDGRQIKSDMLLYAAGRIGATSALGLENCGLDVDHRGRLSVDPLTFQTVTPNIYATGDVIGFPSLASTSMEQGRIAACHAFGAPLPSTHQHFPLGIYSVPEISSVGLTASDAIEQGIACEFGIARIRETSRGHIMGIESGLLKIVVALKTRRVLGVHIIGEGATELIHIGQAVINLGGTIDYFIENSFNYPTLAEAYKIAALDAWNRLESRNVRLKPINKNAKKSLEICSL
jgi:NAD(P) transhydrogenase